MPAITPDEDYQRFEDTANIAITSSRSTPIFISHSADDDVVPIENGRELRNNLQMRRLPVEWREYEDGGHWQGVDDIARFIDKHMASDDSESPRE